MWIKEDDLMDTPDRLEIQKEEILNKLDHFINSNRSLIDIDKLKEIQKMIRML